MIVLHICPMENEFTSGIRVVVPKMIGAHEEKATVGLLNLCDFKPNGVDNCFTYTSSFKISDLPKPFNKPDIAIFHDFYIPKYLGISKVLRKEKIPYIILPHGCLTTGAQKKKRIKKMLGNILFRPFLKGAAAIQFMTEPERQNTKTKHNSIVGGSGWDIPEKQKQSFSSDKIKFVYIGRLDALHKGLDYMLDAFKMVMDSPYKDKCELNIYGPDHNGEYSNIEKMIQERSLNGLVNLNKAVFGEEKENILLNSDIFIQTSRFEALTLGILEAQAYGLPCLVTPGTTWKELVTNYNSGWVSELDAKAIYETIISAIDQRNTFKEKSKNARALVKKEFSWDSFARRTIENYEKLI